MLTAQQGDNMPIPQGQGVKPTEVVALGGRGRGRGGLHASAFAQLPGMKVPPVAPSNTDFVTAKSSGRGLSSEMHRVSVASHTSSESQGHKLVKEAALKLHGVNSTSVASTAGGDENTVFVQRTGSEAWGSAFRDDLSLSHVTAGDSPAQRAGLFKFINRKLTHVNGVAVTSVPEVLAAARNAANMALRFEAGRGNATRQASVSSTIPTTENVKAIISDRALVPKKTIYLESHDTRQSPVQLQLSEKEANAAITAEARRFGIEGEFLLQNKFGDVIKTSEVVDSCHYTVVSQEANTSNTGVAAAAGVNLEVPPVDTLTVPKTPRGNTAGAAAGAPPSPSRSRLSEMLESIGLDEDEPPGVESPQASAVPAAATASGGEANMELQARGVEPQVKDDCSQPATDMSDPNIAPRHPRCKDAELPLSEANQQQQVAEEQPEPQPTAIPADNTLDIKERENPSNFTKSSASTSGSTGASTSSSSKSGSSTSSSAQNGSHNSNKGESIKSNSKKSDNIKNSVQRSHSHSKGPSKKSDSIKSLGTSTHKLSTEKDDPKVQSKFDSRRSSLASTVGLPTRKSSTATTAKRAELKISSPAQSVQSNAPFGESPDTRPNKPAQQQQELKSEHERDLNTCVTGSDVEMEFSDAGECPVRNPKQDKKPTPSGVDTDQELLGQTQPASSAHPTRVLQPQPCLAKAELQQLAPRIPKLETITPAKRRSSISSLTSPRGHGQQVQPPPDTSTKAPLWHRFHEQLTKYGLSFADLSTYTRDELTLLCEAQLGFSQDESDKLMSDNRFQRVDSSSTALPWTPGEDVDGRRDIVEPESALFSQVESVIQSSVTCSRGVSMEVIRIRQLVPAARTCGLYNAANTSLAPGLRQKKVLYYAGPTLPPLSEVTYEALFGEMRRHGCLVFSTEAHIVGGPSASSSATKKLLLCEVIMGSVGRPKGNALSDVVGPVPDCATLNRLLKQEQTLSFQSGVPPADTLAIDYPYLSDASEEGQVATQYVTTDAARVLPRYVAYLRVKNHGLSVVSPERWRSQPNGSNSKAINAQLVRAKELRDSLYQEEKEAEKLNRRAQSVVDAEVEDLIRAIEEKRRSLLSSVSEIMEAAQHDRHQNLTKLDAYISELINWQQGSGRSSGPRLPSLNETIPELTLPTHDVHSAISRMYLKGVP
ncbi:hypothetical protein DIPPA_52830 [Diplonema papillatum]|nr:hypothetical protein DIPPA_52830 [Diplonema papillatum]